MTLHIYRISLLSWYRTEGMMWYVSKAFFFEIRLISWWKQRMHDDTEGVWEEERKTNESLSFSKVSSSTLAFDDQRPTTYRSIHPRWWTGTSNSVNVTDLYGGSFVFGDSVVRADVRTKCEVKPEKETFRLWSDCIKYLSVCPLIGLFKPLP